MGNVCSSLWCFKYIEIHCTFSLQLYNGHMLQCSFHSWFVSAVCQVCVHLLCKFYVLVSYLAEILRAEDVSCIYRTESMFESVQRGQSNSWYQLKFAKTIILFFLSECHQLDFFLWSCHGSIQHSAQCMVLVKARLSS